MFFVAWIPCLAACCERQGVEKRSVADHIVVKLNGSAYRWQLQYAGWDNVHGNADDVFAERDLVLPIGVNARIDLSSDDYIYGLRLPHLSLNQMAVPEIPRSFDVVPDSLGEFPLRGNQMCGFTHPGLLGKIKVVSRAEFVRWLDAQFSVSAGSHRAATTKGN